MKRRLTQEQKYFAVVTTLCYAKFPMTRTQIGKHIGFNNGVPVKEAVDRLLTEGRLIVSTGLVIDREVEYYWLTPEARADCAGNVPAARQE